MADSNLLITGGISTTVQPNYGATDLAPNNYLTIIWRDKQGVQYNNLDIDDKKALQYTTDLSNAIEQAINNGKISYAGSTKYVNVESIAKYLAQNILDTSPQRTVANAIIGVLSGNQKEMGENAINLAVNLFGEIAEKTARSFGFSDPHEVFASLASENSLKIIGELGNKAHDYIQECITNFQNKDKENAGETSEVSETSSQATSKKYVGFILGLTTSDTESYDITIPRKKVEDGSDYTTHLLPQPFKKDFNVILTNKVLSSDYNRTLEIENIEKVKDKLIEIAKSRIPFDIYVRLSADKCYKRSNVYFSSLSFTKDEGSGNNYTCSFTVEPIEAFKSKVFISNRKYFPTASKPQNTGYYGGTRGYGETRGSGGTGSKGSGRGGATTKGNKITVGFYGEKGDITEGSILNEVQMTSEKMYKWAANNGYLILYSPQAQPEFLFVKPGKVTTLKGTYLLAKDTITDWEEKGGRRIQIKRKLASGVILKKGEVHIGKSWYTIRIPQGSTVRGLIKR